MVFVYSFHERIHRFPFHALLFYVFRACHSATSHLKSTCLVVALRVWSFTCQASVGSNARGIYI